MKLLFVSNLFPDKSDPVRGLDNATLLHHLRPHVDEIRVLALRPILPFRTKSWQPRDEDAELNVTYRAVPYIPKIGSRWNHRLMARAIRKPLREPGCDRILVSWLYPDGCAVASVSDVPFTMICQGSDAHAYLKNPVRRKLIVEATGKSRAVITRSADLANLLKNAGAPAEKLKPVYNGVDTSLFRPAENVTEIRRSLGLDPDARWLLFVGNLLPVKNPLLLMEAWHLARRQLPETDVRLAMIGTGPMRDTILAAAEKNGIADSLHLAGRQPPEKVADYMRAADLFCMSSHNEGVPNVVLEAFASGLPVISTNVGGISEVLNRPLLGSLTPPVDAGALAAAIVEKLNSRPETDAIASHSQRHSWQQTVHEYLELL